MQPCLGLRNEVRNTPEGSMRLDLNSNKTIRKSVPFTSPGVFLPGVFTFCTYKSVSYHH